jgi:hypothetical protein
MPPRLLDPATAHACPELLAQTIWHHDPQIERAGDLFSAERAHLFLRAIVAHIADNITCKRARTGQSALAQLHRHD